MFTLSLDLRSSLDRTSVFVSPDTVRRESSPQPRQGQVLTRMVVKRSKTNEGLEEQRGFRR